MAGFRYDLALLVDDGASHYCMSWIAFDFTTAGRKTPYGVLSRQQFASVTRLVESLNGRWVSAGRHSHWEVPKQKQT